MPAMPQMMRSSCFGFFAPPAVTIVVLASPMSFVETTSTNFLTASVSKVAANAWTRWRSPPPGQDQEGREDDFPSQSFREHHALEELLVLVVRAALDHDGIQELCRLCFLLLCTWRRRQRGHAATDQRMAAVHSLFFASILPACMVLSAFASVKSGS